MMNITLAGDRALVTKLDGMPAKLQAALNRKVSTLALQLEAKVKGKLSGPVLKVRTGDLRRSIAQKVESTPTSVIGKVFSSGDVKYAAIHEFGGVIQHPGGTPYFVSKLAAQAIFVRKGTLFSEDLPVTKPHQIKMQERSFLRSSLADMKDEIEGGIRQAVVATLREK